MPANNDVLDLEIHDGEGDDGLGVEVPWREDVGDVAVHKDVAGLQAEHGGFGDTRVGAADPENLGLLAGCEGGEEGGVGVSGFLGPLFVLVEGEGEFVCGGEVDC